MYCIAYPNYPLAYAETFVRLSTSSFDWDFELCHSWFPYRDGISGKGALQFPFNNVVSNGIFRRFATKNYQQKYIKALANYLKKNKIKTVLAQYGLTGANMAEACKIADTQLIVHFHGVDAYQYKTLETYKHKYKVMFDSAKAIIAVSRDMVAQLTKIGAPIDKIHYIPYGIDSEQFNPTSPQQNPPNFVAIGRFTTKKAPQNTLKAFAIVAQHCPEAKLQMAGKGDLFEQCKALAHTLKIADKVDFMGVISPNQVNNLLAKARAFVQHSVIAPDGDCEGTPNAVLEASMKALPIVSTRHTGIKDAVIEGKTGFLVDENDIEAMAKHMIFLANNPEKAGEMGKEGRFFMLENFTKKRFLNLIQKLVFE